MRLKRIIAIFLIIALSSGSLAAFAIGLIPYDTYNYDYWDDIVFTPAAYVPGGSVTGATLGISAFNNAQGMTVAYGNLVYVADTNNDRIIIIEADLQSVRGIIKNFYNDGVLDSFRRPQGVAISNEGRIYVADSENRRVISLEIANFDNPRFIEQEVPEPDEDYGENDEEISETEEPEFDREIITPEDVNVVRVIRDPVSDALPEHFDFVPFKVAVDFAGRVFVIARNMFQGIMTFSPEGEFIGFFGTIHVSPTTWQRFWRFFQTPEQRRQWIQFIPTEFTGLDVDDRGFIFATNLDETGTQAVRRLNPTGEDVIRLGDNENLGGDLQHFVHHPSIHSGASQIIDVVYRGRGMYSILDRLRGRIFTYDHEGNLLYIFGGIGTADGTFRSPTALGAQEGRILALDAMRNEIVVFNETRYGALINQAVALRFDGEEALAVDAWREVLKLHETFELASAGIGKAYLTAGYNREALHYLRLGMDRRHYAIAFRRHRNEVLLENLHWIFSGVFVLLAGFVTWRVIRRRRRGIRSEGGLS